MIDFVVHHIEELSLAKKYLIRVWAEAIFLLNVWNFCVLDVQRLMLRIQSYLKQKSYMGMILMILLPKL